MGDKMFGWIMGTLVSMVFSLVVYLFWNMLVDTTLCQDGYKYSRVNGETFQVIGENGSGVKCK